MYPAGFTKPTLCSLSTNKRNGCISKFRIAAYLFLLCMKRRKETSLCPGRANPRSGQWSDPTHAAGSPERSMCTSPAPGVHLLKFSSLFTCFCHFLPKSMSSSESSANPLVRAWHWWVPRKHRWVNQWTHNTCLPSKSVLSEMHGWCALGGFLTHLFSLDQTPLCSSELR